MLAAEQTRRLPYNLGGFSRDSRLNFVTSREWSRGISDIEGKAATGSGERVGKRASFKFVSLFLLFLAEFLESGIGAQRIPERIEPKVGRGDWGQSGVLIAIARCL